ncbi:putative RNA polymerase, sigma-24 subunit, ECF subfamily [Pedosphaera parvula Ellin514]|uniref:Putative RNA polymerase, sigma-24 subunit, ECF subfamily n=2 Tax=Pedosphaera TaxID=1032526 RepID=B9XQD3_PEDPL|nr:putative RNA polymerase, sigma-24 subunit, ECF subfamily [Pedosphaera parvula Ellin514]
MLERMSQTADITTPPPTGDISRLADHLFRHEAGKLVSVLTGIFGFERLQLAEDVVQEALIRALQTWPYYGIPRNPAAWLTQTAKNLALDVIRREKLFLEKQSQITTFMEQWSAEPSAGDAALLDNEIKDDGLRMMFVCCHPLVPADDQVALTLKTLCGFSPLEIAKAFLTTEAAIAKRLTRAKQKIRDARIPFEIPTGEELTRRLDNVLQSLYLLFNEGYKASSGEKLVREEVCYEAIRLTVLLAEHAAGNQPKTHALLALMLLNSARNPTRLDGQGNLLRLKEQDRTRWDQRMIALGMFHLAQSAAGEEITEYHLQAGIAACHCAAKDYASTDWRQILALYDQLMEFDHSPVIALNRAVVVANIHGPGAGVEAVEAIQNQEKLDSYYLLYAVLGEFESQLNDPLAAAGYFRKSLQLAETKSEQQFLSKRFRDCEEQIPA